MNYTSNYPLLVRALYEAEFQIIKDHTNRKKAISVIEKIMQIRNTVEKIETDSGNTKPVDIQTPDFTQNGSFRQEPCEKQQLQMELNNTRELCERALEFYKSDSEDFDSMFPLLVETEIVPVTDNPAYLASVIDGYIESFRKHTAQTTGYDLDTNEFLSKAIRTMADNITLEITESPNHEVNKKLKNVEMFETSINILGLLKTHSIKEHIEASKADEVSKLVDDLFSSKSNIFG